MPRPFRREVRAHVCSALVPDRHISQRLDELAAAETEAAPAEQSNLSPGDGGDRVAPGTSIGRFTVVGPLGRGGMGTVVSARDPRLDREVAIKLVSGGGDAEGAAGRDRLLREGRAMAKLRHPNVVAVYEVGEHLGQVYLAMEQVDGGTLRHALRELRARGGADWRAVLDLFIAAGRGLAAAHERGMVHRDFKPENVLVDDSGRVLVADFGLVDTSESLAALDGDEGVAVHERLTLGGVVAGTPAYMAPEQHRGQPVDPRADQFSFCVALYEALYGELPFAGDTRRSYVDAVTRGEIRLSPPQRSVPRWLRDTLARGLAADPEARYPSMDALLAELGADPKRLRRLGHRERALAVAGGAAFVAAWGAALFGYGIRITYEALYIANGAFGVLMFALAYLGRRTFARTTFNLKVIGIALAMGPMLVGVVAGGQLLDIPPISVAILHLVVVGACMLLAAITLDGRLWLSAATYFAGFFIAALWPSLFGATLLTVHLIVGANLYITLDARGREQRAGKCIAGR